MTIAWSRAIAGLVETYPLDVLLRLARIPRSTYYWAIRHADDDRNADVKAEIQAVFAENKERYGVRRVYLEITDAEGKYRRKISHGKVQRLMHEMYLKARRKRRGRYNSYKGTVGKTAPNIIDRDFTAEAPNMKWGTDVTEFGCRWGKAYLSPIIDFFDGSVVAYDVSMHPNFEQTMSMLRLAEARQPKMAGIILHSDQGWQYQMAPYQVFLEERGMIQSMSRKGNCLDNARTENFFGRMKVEMFYGHEDEFKSFEELKKAIDEYVSWYNNERIRLRLKMSPELFRRHFNQSCDMI